MKEDDDSWVDDALHDATKNAGIEVDLGRIDMSRIVYGDDPPTRPGLIYRPDGSGLIYPGATHGLHGEPGHGKTWFIVLAVAEALKAGQGVLMLDYEGSPHGFAERLEAVGVTKEVIADPARLAYHNIPGATDERHVAGLAEEVDDLSAVFIAVDAMLPALARNGLHDNDNSDVATFFENMARPLASLGASVILLDHVTKDSTGRMRGARGAGAKLQLVDVSYSLALKEQFSRAKAGSFRIACAKDRFGTFGIGESVATIHVVPFEHGARVELRVEAPTAADESWNGPTFLMEQVSKYLEAERLKRIDHPTTNEICDHVKGRKQWVIQALDELEQGGWIGRHQDGRSVRYQLSVPYREGDEPPGAQEQAGGVAGA
jgi:AAA domain